MIPKLSQAPQTSQTTTEFLQQLKIAGFVGDTTTHYAECLALSTDNSIYQRLPEAVVYPRDTDDVVILTKLANQVPYQSLLFTARGGETGTNGQALNQGVVVDMSRYMTRLIELNVEQGWVRVEAGVTKDQLNAWLAPHGFFFAPELSTSNRATLGGMINTDASGQGSLVYGKTSDHVLALQVVLIDGECFESCPISRQEAENRASQPSKLGRIYQQVLASCIGHRSHILSKFPPLNRFLTGYDLRHAISDDFNTVDLNRILCGSEGSLAFITQATLRITPLPKYRQLLNIKFDNFDAALRSANLMLSAKALSVETLDARVLNLARGDIIWHAVSNLLTNVPGKVFNCLNIVEFVGDDATLLEQQIQALSTQLDAMIQRAEGGIIGWQRCTTAEEVANIYTMRKKAVGLLGRVNGVEVPIPFVEDTAVPPEHLTAYISEFRALLDQYGLAYGMFGHIDAGVLHVRPALDMCNPEHQQLIRTISDKVVALTARYGGILWGEHGRGYRAEYGQSVFGPKLYTELQRIKAAFDPDNRMNRGKICSSYMSVVSVVTVTQDLRGTKDQSIPPMVRQQWRDAMACNGNGLCFDFDESGLMCPSMKIMRNRLHSPKGRATVIREWLRLLTLEKYTNFEARTSRFSPFAWFKRRQNSRQALLGDYDFSHEVKAAMLSCLSCKACATLCPLGVDVSSLRARFLQLYYTRYSRPASDYLIANIERYLPSMARMPSLVNHLLGSRKWTALSEKWLKLVDLPCLSTPPLMQRLSHHPAITTSLIELKDIAPSLHFKYVFILQDAFTSYYEAQLVVDLIGLIEKLGYRPILLPFMANGKPQYIAGFIHAFARTAAKTAHFLNRLSQLQIPIIGIDPAMVLCFRDEYSKVLGAKRGKFNVLNVLIVQEWLAHVIGARQARPLQEGSDWYLFAHCTEANQLPTAAKQWQTLFAHVGAKLELIRTGCCGMAGTYGHMQSNQTNSHGIYALSWQPALDRLPYERCLATGYSCRNQVKRIDSKVIRHPLQALLKLL